MAVIRHLGFYQTANSAVRSADPEIPSLEPNMEWTGCTVCGIFTFTVTLKLSRDYNVNNITGGFFIIR